MEITKTFGNTIGDMIRAKLRWFMRRSFFRYAIGVALVTFGLHGRDASIGHVDLLMKGLTYFIALCLGVLVLQVVAAAIQSRRITPRTVTFTKTRLTVVHKGESVAHDWDWIIVAEDSRTVISLLIQRFPRLELYLPKSKLSDIEYRTLRGWLVAHGKLKSAEHAE